MKIEWIQLIRMVNNDIILFGTQGVYIAKVESVLNPHLHIQLQDLLISLNFITQTKT